MSFTTQQPPQYSVTSGTTQHRTAKPCIRPNNQAPPHNALQHLAPTLTTPHYPISLHISPHHQTPSSISRNILHRTTAPTNITYRPALSSTCAHDDAPCYTTLCSTSQHRTTPHQPALLRTTKYHPASLLIMAHQSMFIQNTEYRIQNVFIVNQIKPLYYNMLLLYLQ